MEIIRVTSKPTSELHCNKSPVFVQSDAKCTMYNLRLCLTSGSVYANANLIALLLACDCMVDDVLSFGGEIASVSNLSNPLVLVQD